MSNHSVGYASHKILKGILEMKDSGEIKPQTARKLIDLALYVVYYEDGNRSEATMIFENTHCGRCLKPYDKDEKMFDLYNSESAFLKARTGIDIWDESYTLYICEECFDEMLQSIDPEIRKKLFENIREYEDKYGSLWCDPNENSDP